MVRPILFFACLAALVLACDHLPAEPGQPLPLGTVHASQYSGFDDGHVEVIRDRETWQRAWDGIHAHASPQPPLPTVDFGRYMLLLVALGERPNGCFDVEIRSAVLAHGQLRVSARELVPTAGCSCTQALVQPVEVVRVDRVAGPAEFEIREVRLSCG